MRRVVLVLVLALVVVPPLVACSRTPPPTGDPAGTTPPRASPSAATVSSAASEAASEPASDARSCAGDAAKGVTCLRFATAEGAFRHVLRGDVGVLAIGEAHAQKGSEAVASSTKRFTEQLLPIVATQAADIVVELWAPDPKCQKEVKAVASAQKPVTETQAATNTNEYETLGVKAKQAGLTPWLLRPTCEDFSALADAGADRRVPAMLSLVKRLTQQKMIQLLEKNAKAKKTTIAYGGAMHNDVAPAATTAQWSFGPDLVKAVAQSHAGVYVELDLIVPEHVKKTATWEKLPWFSAWDGDNAPKDEATLYVIANGTPTPSYVLVFPAAR